jgi:beta-glucanase (GH16 family)
MYQLTMQIVKRVVLLGLGVLTAEICGMAAVPSGFGTTPIFDEEFTENSLNTRIWTYRAEGKLRKYCYVDSSAVAVANGYARISIYTANNSQGVAMNYCGAVTTQSGTFLNTYGYWEASVRFHYQPGMQSAFWVQSPSIGSITNNPQQSGVEMDVFEHIQSADRTSYNHAVWWNNGAYTKGTYHVGTQSNLDDGNFHAFGLAWTPGSLTFYVDGVQTWHLSASEVAISNIAEYIILDTELPSASGVPTEGYGPLGSSSNAYFDIDYVRVYPYSMKTTSTTLSAVEDTYVRDGKAETANFFCSPTLFVKKEATGYNRNSYLKFDLSHITAPVLQATLYLTPTVIEEDNVTTIARYVPVNSWTADSITWKNQPVTSVQLSTGTNYSVGTLTNFDVTAVATAGQAFSVQIAADASSGSPASVVGYGSQENSATTYRPQLVIISGELPSNLRPRAVDKHGGPHSTR